MANYFQLLGFAGRLFPDLPKGLHYGMYPKPCLDSLYHLEILSPRPKTKRPRPWTPSDATAARVRSTWIAGYDGLMWDPKEEPALGPSCEPCIHSMLYHIPYTLYHLVHIRRILIFIYHIPHILYHTPYTPYHLVWVCGLLGP